MKRHISRWALASLLLAGGAVMVWSSQRASTRGHLLTSTTLMADATSAAGASPASLTREQEALLSDPRVVAWRGQEDFRRRLREFFVTAPGLPAVQRDEQARVLQAQVQRREGNGELSAAEALLLEIGLIKATARDEAEQAALATAVAERYRLRTEQRERAWAAQPKPRFDAYKRREAEIVREVMAMRQIPGGVSRDEYLRQRLQQAREQAYARN